MGSDARPRPPAQAVWDSRGDHPADRAVLLFRPGGAAKRPRRCDPYRIGDFDVIDRHSHPYLHRGHTDPNADADRHRDRDSDVHADPDADADDHADPDLYAYPQPNPQPEPDGDAPAALGNFHPLATPAHAGRDHALVSWCRRALLCAATSPKTRRCGGSKTRRYGWQSPTRGGRGAHTDTNWKLGAGSRRLLDDRGEVGGRRLAEHASRDAFAQQAEDRLGVTLDRQPR